MKKKYIVLILISCFVVAMFITLLLIYGLVQIIVFYTTRPILSNGTDDYLQIKNSDMTSLEIFPENLDYVSTVNNYYHVDYKFDGAEVFLDATYSSEKFEEEIKRLENLSCDFSGKKSVKDNCEYFNIEAYITVFNFTGSYEYALIDAEKNRIVYVALCYIDEKKVTIDKTYLPKNYETIKTEIGCFSFNMYGRP